MKVFVEEQLVLHTLLGKKHLLLDPCTVQPSRAGLLMWLGAHTKELGAEQTLHFRGQVIFSQF